MMTANEETSAAAVVEATSPLTPPSSETAAPPVNTETAGSTPPLAPAASTSAPAPMAASSYPPGPSQPPPYGSPPSYPPGYNSLHTLPHPAAQQPYYPSTYPPFPSASYPYSLPQQQMQVQQNIDDDDDEHWILSSAKASLLLTTGGMIGLTAAAGWRWLNGGDFSLLPPAVRQQSEAALASEQQRQQTTESNQKEEEAATVRNESNKETTEILRQVQQVVQQMQSQSERQERALQKLTHEYDKTQTDAFVNLLREENATNTTDATTQVMDKLQAIQTQLVEIRDATRNANDDGSETTTGEKPREWETKLSTTLQELSVCLEQLHRKPSNNHTQTTTPSNKAADSNKQNGNVSTRDADISGGTQLSFETSPTDDSSNGSSSNDNHNNCASPPSLQTAIAQLAQASTTADSRNDLREGAQVLYLYVTNLLQGNHKIPRYRKIFTSNESFQKVARLKGGQDLLLAVGFSPNEKNTKLEWLSKTNEGDQSNNNHDEEALTQRYLDTLKMAQAALNVFKSTSRTTDDPAELTRLALAAASSSLLSSSSLSGTATPPLVYNNSSSNNNNSNSSLLPHPPGTPEIGSIVSPPVTKKQFLSSDDESSVVFPPLHPLAKTDKHLSKNQGRLLQQLQQQSLQESSQSPIRGEDIEHDEKEVDYSSSS